MTRRAEGAAVSGSGPTGAARRRLVLETLALSASLAFIAAIVLSVF